jgi:hypothetical protein
MAFIGGDVNCVVRANLAARKSGSPDQGRMAVDLDNAPAFMGASAWDLKYRQDQWPEVVFFDIKDYQKAAEAPAPVPILQLRLASLFTLCP